MATKHPPLPPFASHSEEEINEYYNRVFKYTVTMATFRTMYKQGKLDLEGYIESEKIIAEKYGIPDNSIHRQINPEEK